MPDPVVKVICDFQISEFCKINYSITKYRLKENRERNNDNYRCKYCAIFATHEGELSHYHKLTNINHQFFNKIDSEIKSYLLGLIAGDGYISRKSVGIVANIRDKETVELFASYISPQTKIGLSKNGKYVTAVVTSKKLVEDLRWHLRVWVNKKSNLISMPGLDTNLVPHFIRGLVDSDGCIDNPFSSKTPRCFYSSTSVKILNQVRAIACEQYATGHIQKIKLVFVCSHAIKFLNFIYKDSNFHLSRKKFFYKTWLQWVGSRRTLSLKEIQEIKLSDRKIYSTKYLAEKYQVGIDTIKRHRNSKVLNVGN